MKTGSARPVRIFAAALLATAFSLPAARAAGSVEDLKPAAAPARETVRQGVPAPSARTAFDEFSVIGDPLYRQGSIEFLKKAVEADKAVPAEKKAPAAPAGDLKGKAAPAVKKAVPSKEARPSDLRDAPSSGVRKILPAPRLKSPAPKPVPADPVAPRKAS